MYKIKLLLLLAIFSIFSNYSFAQPLSNNQFAIENLKQSIRENKLDQGAYMALIYYYSEENDYKNMLDTINQVNKLFEKDEKILQSFNNYAKDYYLKKNYEISKKIAQITLDKYKDPDTAFIYAENLKSSNSIAQAISFLENFISKYPDNTFLNDILTNYYIYDNQLEKGFNVVKKAQKYHLENIQYYFTEALLLQNLNLEQSKIYYKAYLDKLEFSTDVEERIKSTIAILKTISNKQASANDYIALINTLKKLKAPASVMLIQYTFAKNKFPETKFFSDNLNLEYTNIFGKNYIQR